MAKGLITDIQRFSLNDGPGIRSTVFFKGCNMHCTWCHNPETISMKNNLLFYSQKCIGCGKCFEVCPVHAHERKNGMHLIHRDKCISCGKCAEECYPQALAMAGKEVDTDFVIKEVLQDRLYYKNSGGGVTLSGGEVLMQMDFAKDICKRLRDEGIEVAIESNMSLPFDTIKELIDMVDLVMMDVKIFDDTNHKKYTGVSNANVIENLKKLNEINKPVIVRTPLIPGVTDSLDNLKNIAKLLEGMENVICYELLNFNPLGDSKYKGLNEENAFEGEKPFKDSHLEEIKDSLKDINVNIKIGG
ncbi:MAG: glycyl-radical enzyme activating protein [Ruminococcaceae bacterium]|nr:glycyl-radical enzyme activating protein [Oscillospiraceae bacterium]